MQCIFLIWLESTHNSPIICENKVRHIICIMHLETTNNNIHACKLPLIICGFMHTKHCCWYTIIWLIAYFVEAVALSSRCGGSSWWYYNKHVCMDSHMGGCVIIKILWVYISHNSGSQLYHPWPYLLALCTYTSMLPQKEEVKEPIHVYNHSKGGYWFMGFSSHKSGSCKLWQ